MNKFLELLSSRRFIMLVAAAIVFVVSDGEVTAIEALEALGAVLGIATGIGTVDKAMANFKK